MVDPMHFGARSSLSVTQEIQEPPIFEIKSDTNELVSHVMRFPGCEAQTVGRVSLLGAGFEQLCAALVCATSVRYSAVQVLRVRAHPRSNVSGGRATPPLEPTGFISIPFPFHVHQSTTLPSTLRRRLIPETTHGEDRFPCGDEKNKTDPTTDNALGLDRIQDTGALGAYVWR
jgi:hypothetical protein